MVAQSLLRLRQVVGRGEHAEGVPDPPGHPHRVLEVLRGPLVVAPGERQCPQKHEGLGLVPRVPGRAVKPPDLLQETGASGRVATPQSAQPRAHARPGDARFVLHPPEECEALLVERHRPKEVTHAHQHGPRHGERPRPFARGKFVSPCQRRFHPRVPLAVVASGPPE